MGAAFPGVGVLLRLAAQEPTYERPVVTPPPAREEPRHALSAPLVLANGLPMAGTKAEKDTESDEWNWGEGLAPRGQANVPVLTKDGRNHRLGLH